MRTGGSVELGVGSVVAVGTLATEARGVLVDISPDDRFGVEVVVLAVNASTVAFTFASISCSTAARRASTVGSIELDSPQLNCQITSNPISQTRTSIVTS